MRTFGLERDLAQLRCAWKHLSIDSKLAKAADDKVGVLRPEVEHEAGGEVNSAELICTAIRPDSHCVVCMRDVDNIFYLFNVTVDSILHAGAVFAQLSIDSSHLRRNKGLSKLCVQNGLDALLVAAVAKESRRGSAAKFRFQFVRTSITLPNSCQIADI